MAHVLVSCGNADAAALVVGVCRYNGWGVTVANTSEEIREIIARGTVTVSILDLQSLYAFALDQLDSRSGFAQKLPVVLLSDEVSSEHAIALRESGVFYHAILPLQPNELSSVLYAAIEEAKGMDDGAGGPPVSSVHARPGGRAGDRNPNLGHERSSAHCADDLGILHRPKGLVAWSASWCLAHLVATVRSIDRGVIGKAK